MSGRMEAETNFQVDGSVFKAFICAIAFHFLTGCSTTPTPDNRVKIAPDERYLVKLKREPDSALLTLIRDEGFVGGAVFIHLMLDGEDVARLNVGEQLTIPVDPGEHQICGQLRAIGTGKPICLDLNLKPNQSVLIRPGIDINAGLVMHKDMSKRQ